MNFAQVLFIIISFKKKNKEIKFTLKHFQPSKLSSLYSFNLTIFNDIYDIYDNHLPDFQCVFAEFPPANQRRNTDSWDISHPASLL